MITHNWNIKDDYSSLNKKQQRREDQRESDYHNNQEDYIVKANSVWLKDFGLELGTTREEAHKYHMSDIPNVLSCLNLFGIDQNNIEIYHYRPVARLDVNTAKHYHPTDKQAKRYIVQYEDGLVYNSLFNNCYHWQIATPVSFDEAFKLAQGHMAMAPYMVYQLDVWILVLDWVKEDIQDVKAV